MKGDGTGFVCECVTEMCTATPMAVSGVSLWATKNSKIFYKENQTYKRALHPAIICLLFLNILTFLHFSSSHIKMHSFSWNLKYQLLEALRGNHSGRIVENRNVTKDPHLVPAICKDEKQTSAFKNKQTKERSLLCTLCNLK